LKQEERKRLKADDSPLNRYIPEHQISVGYTKEMNRNYKNLFTMV
jgi:hypothetical protein